MSRLFVIAVLGCILALGASADVITFDPGFVGPVSSLTVGPVTFSAVGGGGVLYTDIGPNGTNGLADYNSPMKELQAHIAGGANSVSVDLGDYDQDSDLLVLRVYNAAHVLLGSTSLLIDGSFVGMKTLSLSAPNIFFAEFGAEPPAGNGSSVYADNFTYGTGTIPEPASVGLLLLSVLGIGLLRQARVR